MRVLLPFVFILLTILIGIFAINTLRFSSKRIPIEAIEPTPIDSSVLKRFAEAIKIPTITTYERIDSTAFFKLDTLISKTFPLADSMLEVQKFNQFSRLYKWPGKNAKLKPILLMGHLDVVPIEAESADKWTQDPFSGKIDDTYIWGRGTMDDKSTIFSILEAIELLLTEDYIPERTIYLAFGHDEEISGKNGAAAIATFLEQKGISFEFVLDEGHMIIEDALSAYDGPIALIGLGEKGYTTFTLTAKLEHGGHSSMPPKQTAIGVLSTAINRLQNNPLPAKIDGATAKLFKHIGPEMSMPYKVLFANLWLTKGIVKNVFSANPQTSAMIRTTTAPTVINGGVKDNVLPTMASAKVNFRILPGETIDYVKEYVEKVIEDPRIKVEVGTNSSNPPPLAGTNTFGYQVIYKSIQQIFPDVLVTPALTIATTDSRYYTKVSSNIYRFTPLRITNAELEGFHGVNERLRKENYIQMIQFFHQLIQNSCK